MRDYIASDDTPGLQGYRLRWSRSAPALAFQGASDSRDEGIEFSDPLDVPLDTVRVQQPNISDDSFGNVADSPSALEQFSLDDDDSAFSVLDSPLDSPAPDEVEPLEPPKLMVATAKSKPQIPEDSGSSNLRGVKRVADELSARLLHERMSKMKQPWQQGPLSSLFTRPKSFWQVDNTTHCIGLYDHLTTEEKTSIKPEAASSSILGKQRIRTARMINDEDDFRRTALERFKTMILSDLTCTRLGRSLLTFAGTLCTNDELSQIFSDVFSPKATGTIIKRCNSMWRFYHWIHCRGGGSPFSQEEGVLYEYISQLRIQAGATAPSQFVESLRFCDGLFGLDKVPTESSLSSRVVGAAHSSYMAKRIRRPAEPLTVSEIEELERLCSEGHPTMFVSSLGICSSASWLGHAGMIQCILLT